MADRLPVAERHGVNVLRTLDAPVIYFDYIANSGSLAGVVNIGIALRRYTAEADGSVRMDVAAVADLRCPVIVAEFLRETLEQAIDGAKSVNPVHEPLQETPDRAN